LPIVNIKNGQNNQNIKASWWLLLKLLIFIIKHKIETIGYQENMISLDKKVAVNLDVVK